MSTDLFSRNYKKIKDQISWNSHESFPRNNVILSNFLKLLLADVYKWRHANFDVLKKGGCTLLLKWIFNFYCIQRFVTSKWLFKHLLITKSHRNATVILSPKSVIQSLKRRSLTSSLIPPSFGFRISCHDGSGFGTSNGNSNSNFLRIVDRSILSSNMANFCPMQFRGPAENGM